MTLSSTIPFPHFKSPSRCLSRSFYQSRHRWREKSKQLLKALERLRDQLAVVLEREKQQAAELGRFKRQIQALQAETSAPQWTPLAGHQFSAPMIALCCRLSNLIGFRAVPKVLHCVADAFGLPLKIPTRDAVRNWNCRNGVAILQEAQKADDWIWMIDHSVQLGKMCVLAVLGVRRTELPQDRPLKRDDMTPLAVMPSDSRNKQEVTRQLLEVVARCGVPLAVLCDGACELHEAVEALKTEGFQGVCIGDIKHKVANLLKKTLGRDERFAAFEAKLGRTTAAIQQTELEHLLPPRKKQKCRFMNFDRLIDWATMVEKQLQAPTVSKRLTEKLGWLAEFREDLNGWRECRRLIGCALSFANAKGLWRGATDLLSRQLAELPANCRLAEHLREQITTFYRMNEKKLHFLRDETLCLPCSTEVLESAFGSFKAVQHHHNRGTFTTLLAVFPTLFDTCTAEKIRERFGSTSNRDVKTWLTEAGLLNSTQSRRTQAYREVLTRPNA